MFVAWFFGLWGFLRLQNFWGSGGVLVWGDLLWLGVYRFVRVAACGLVVICFAGWSDLVYPGVDFGLDCLCGVALWFECVNSVVYGAAFIVCFVWFSLLLLIDL